MATHSIALGWRIPGTGEPGGRLSMRSHRVGHDWSDLAAAAAACKHERLPQCLSGKESTCNAGDRSEVAQLCLTLCNPIDYSLPGFSVHGIFQATAVDGLPFPSPGIFLTQESSLGLPHCRQRLYCLSHQESPGDTWDVGSIPESWSSPGGGHGIPLQYYCWENPMDRGAWWAIVHEGQTWLKQLSTHTHTHTHPNVYTIGMITFYHTMIKITI